MIGYPVDSADAREMREAADEAEIERLAADREHADHCVDGWLGVDEDGRPRPCLKCKPHLGRRLCRVCSLAEASCAEQRATGRGRCCDACDHPEALG